MAAHNLSNPEYAESVGRLLHWRTRRAEVSGRRHTVHRCVGQTSECITSFLVELEIGWAGYSSFDIISLCDAPPPINVGRRIRSHIPLSLQSLSTGELDNKGRLGIYQQSLARFQLRYVGRIRCYGPFLQSHPDEGGISHRRETCAPSQRPCGRTVVRTTAA